MTCSIDDDDDDDEVDWLIRLQSVVDFMNRSFSIPSNMLSTKRRICFSSHIPVGYELARGFAQLSFIGSEAMIDVCDSISLKVQKIIDLYM
jgi:hypothetical protein